MKRFLKILALFLAPVILLLGMFSLALVRSGELTPTADIEAAALNGGLELFGLAYRDDTRALKQAVANARGADVLVLGTSRSMQLRGAFFASDSFYNAGGGIAYIFTGPGVFGKHARRTHGRSICFWCWTSISIMRPGPPSNRRTARPCGPIRSRTPFTLCAGHWRIIWTENIPCCMCWARRTECTACRPPGAAQAFTQTAHTPTAPPCCTRKKAWTQSLRIRSSASQKTRTALSTGKRRTQKALPKRKLCSLSAPGPASR